MNFKKQVDLVTLNKLGMLHSISFFSIHKRHWLFNINLVSGFTHFMMFSEWQEVIDPTKRKQIYQDMTQPLSHYWIASSHNT